MNRTGDKIDIKNIGLVKVLYLLRSDLDTYTLINLNVDKINIKGRGKAFWTYVRNLSISSIALGISRVYEVEKHNELYSLPGLIRMIENQNLVPLNRERSQRFFSNYGHFASPGNVSSEFNLKNVVDGFIASKNEELSSFKTFRDKVIAHGEFGAEIDALPSYAEMEQLFSFAKSFYYVVSSDYIGVGPADLDSNQYLKAGLKAILKELLGGNIESEWES